MCVIAVSKIGERQPTMKELRSMFEYNSHGAGYMVARSGKVEIHKGFMFFEDFARAVKSERFTASDAVVYHFRISTQAGVNPEMTQPFPFSKNLDMMRKLDLIAPAGIAHNGVISMTSDKDETTYSDTALFIAKYLPRLIKDKRDIDNPYTQDIIKQLIGWSKLAILTGDGGITTIGPFVNDGGVLLSNTNHKGTWRQIETKDGKYKWVWDARKSFESIMTE